MHPPVPPDPAQERLAFVRTVTRLSGRVAGSHGERQAQELLAGRLQRLGFEVTVEGAVCPPQPPLVLALHAVVLLLGIAGTLIAPWWGLGISVLGGVSFWGVLRGAPQILGRLLLRRISGNVVARLRRPGEPAPLTDQDESRAPKIVLVAHADVASSSTLFRPWVRRFWDEQEGEGQAPAERRLRMHPGTLVLAGAASQGLAALGALAGVDSLALHGLLLAAALVHLGLGLLALDWWRSPPVEGAIDNASGLAVLVGLAEDAVAEPLREVELWVVGTGDREPDAGGMQAFLFQFGALLDPRNTVFVNIDDVGRGTLHVGTSEGRWDRLPYRPFVAGLAERLARSGRFGEVPLASLSGTTDAGPPTEAGFAAVTLTSLVQGRAPREAHTHEDRYESLEPAALEAAFAFAQALVRALDDEMGMADPSASGRSKTLPERGSATHPLREVT